jgi:hypothetical protein
MTCTCHQTAITAQIVESYHKPRWETGLANGTDGTQRIAVEGGDLRDDRPARVFGPGDAVHSNRQLPPKRMALCHTPAIRLLAPCWQVVCPSDPQNHCPGSISPRSISCWLSQPNVTELCHWKVLMSKVLPGFVFKALAVRKDAMTAVRLLCQGQA